MRLNLRSCLALSKAMSKSFLLALSLICGCEYYLSISIFSFIINHRHFLHHRRIARGQTSNLAPLQELEDALLRETELSCRRPTASPLANGTTLV